MTKLDKLIILVMEELANEGINHRRTNENELAASSFNIRIRFSKNADCVYINTADYEFNEVVFYNLKNERGRLISTGAIMNTFFRILSVLAKRQPENVSRETYTTPETENVSRETSHTADTGNYTQESAITPIITPKFTDEEINNELSKVEMRMEDLLRKELEYYTFKYTQYKRYHTAHIVIAFIINDDMFAIDFATKSNSLDGNVTVKKAYTDEILDEKEYLCFNIDNYHRSICSIFYHNVRKIKRMYQ